MKLANQNISKDDIAVIIPVYKRSLDNAEMEYFKHNCTVLQDYPLFLVAPAGLNVEKYLAYNDVSVKYFDATFFKNIAGYNRLLLSELFYNSFDKYKYILICQTDAFVFKDELLSWCQKGYDYIGAPWINKPFFLFQYVLTKMGPLYALRMVFSNNLFKAVGNGGLSLRKVNSFITALKHEKNRARWKLNEDFYWSFFARVENQLLRKPDAKEAALFAIETDPERTMKSQNNEFPMGIHAWERYNPAFWKPFIERTLNATNDFKL